MPTRERKSFSECGRLGRGNGGLQRLSDRTAHIECGVGASGETAVERLLTIMRMLRVPLALLSAKRQALRTATRSPSAAKPNRTACSRSRLANPLWQLPAKASRLVETAPTRSPPARGLLQPVRRHWAPIRRHPIPTPLPSGAPACRPRRTALRLTMRRRHRAFMRSPSVGMVRTTAGRRGNYHRHKLGGARR